jgi:3-deoxy-D-manno-octulosonic-acid transferase
MGMLLNLIYLLTLVLAMPWLLWQRLRHGKYREGLAARFLGKIPRRKGRSRCIWLHAVSVGEVNLLAPILARFERLHPDWECVISTTTQAGYALAQKRYAPRTVFYMPLDFTWAVRRAMRRIRPDLLVLAELELWPNLIRAAKAFRAKVAVINGRLSERSFRGYQRIGWLARRILAQVDLIAVQSDEYAWRFRKLGAEVSRVHVTGSVKFDGASTDRGNAATVKLAALAGTQEGDMVFLAGSTQAPEESLAIELFRRVSRDHPRLRLILVPRHPERFEEVARLLDKSGLAWQRRSEIGKGSGDRSRESLTTHHSPLTSRVLLVDAVGELAAWWGTAQIAFVGGSLGNRGGQNMIEPAAYGAAVSFGPNTWNFRDVVSLLLAQEAAVVVNSAAELETFVRRCLADADFVRQIGSRAQELVQRQIGASDRTVELLARLAPPRPAHAKAA